jgi:hypothetical protein
MLKSSAGSDPSSGHRFLLALQDGRAAEVRGQPVLDELGLLDDGRITPLGNEHLGVAMEMDVAAVRCT